MIPIRTIYSTTVWPLFPIRVPGRGPGRKLAACTGRLNGFLGILIKLPVCPVRAADQIGADAAVAAGPGINAAIIWFIFAGGAASADPGRGPAVWAAFTGGEADPEIGR